jgi:hypothetical protein
LLLLKVQALADPVQQQIDMLTDLDSNLLLSFFNLFQASLILLELKVWSGFESEQVLMWWTFVFVLWFCRQCRA